MEDIGAASLSSVKEKYPSLQLNYSKAITWLNHDAWELSYQIQTDGKIIDLLQRVYLYKQHFIVATYTAIAREKDPFVGTAIKILNSIQLL